MLTRRGLLKASLPILAAPAIIRVADLMRISPISVPKERFMVVYSDYSVWGRDNAVKVIESGFSYSDNTREPQWTVVHFYDKSVRVRLDGNPQIIEV